MSSGGARGRSGPAPDPNALRRDRDNGGWTTLPAEGRKGRAPKWPLLGAEAHIEVLQHAAAEDQDLLDVVEVGARKLHARELELWRREWKRPQAVMWERYGLEDEVAMYVRCLAAAERTTAAITLRNLVKQQREALGISLPGLQRNRWLISAAPPAAAETSAPAPTRSRFQVVRGGAG